MRQFVRSVLFLTTTTLSFLMATHTNAEKILTTTLANGLNVVIKENPRAPLAMVQVWYTVGGVDEPKEKLGISHVLEHMMFKGTIRVPDDELKLLNRRFGGSLNAFTSNNYTYYYQLYPKDYLDLALELEADRMSGLYLQQKDLTTEIKVVMEERRQRTDDNPQALAFEKFRYAAYPQNNYQNPVIGHMKNLQNIDLKDLQQWYQLWYAPNNATVVVVGDVNPQQTLLKIQRYFGDIPTKTLPARAQLSHPTHLGYRHVDIENSTEVPNLYMAWNVPSLKTANIEKDAYSLMLLKQILSGNLSARLNTELVQKQKILTTASVSYDFIQRGDTLFTITAIPTQGVALKTAQQAILQIIDQLKAELISEDELQQTIVNTLSQLIYSQDTISGQAQLLGSLQVMGFKAETANEFSTKYQSVQPQDIQAVIRRYLSNENLTTLYLQSEKYKQITAGKDLPSPDNIAPPTLPETTTSQEQ